MKKKAQIIWSPLAEESYLECLQYIIDKWNHKEALKVDSLVEEVISKIASYHHICPASKAAENIRRCVISKQTSMFLNDSNS